MVETILDVDKDGNIRCLYTDEVNLFSLGRVTNVRKASNVEFDEPSQSWQVLSLEGEVLFTNSSREIAIQKEIELFSPGGEYWQKAT